jgi:hypothetical protein
MTKKVILVLEREEGRVGGVGEVGRMIKRNESKYEKLLWVKELIAGFSAINRFFL